MDEHKGADLRTLLVDDPWRDGAATGLWAPDPKGPDRTPDIRTDEVTSRQAAAYREEQRSVAFQEVRRRYREFVYPAVAGFVSWCLLYVVAATTAPRLMAHRVGWDLNVATVAGPAQFATMFLLTWMYVRRARLRRERVARGPRWTPATRTGHGQVR